MKKSVWTNIPRKCNHRDPMDCRCPAAVSSPDSASQKREYSGRPPETFGISIAYDHAMGTRVIKPNARKPAIGGLFANSRRFRKIPHWVAGDAVLIASVSERPQGKIDEVYWGPI
jgi:hypothetical protein